MMQRFWSQLAIRAGKHAGIVSVIGLLLTMASVVGISKLEFATGQDSYLNASDQVYKDNVAYQDLFGGQAMLTLVTMNKGHRVDELFRPEALDTWKALEQRLDATGAPLSVVTPRTALQFADALVRSPDGDPTTSVAGKALLRALAEDPTEAGRAARAEDSTVTLQRLGAIPTDERVLGDEAYNAFLLYDRNGDVRKSLRSFIIDERHAQVVTRLEGNLSIQDEGDAADAVVTATADLAFPNATVVTTGAPVLLQDINDYLKGGMLTLGAIAVGVMVIILLVLFDVRWRLLPLFVILIGVTWAFGLAGALGIPLTLVTIAGLPVMLGVGIDYAIQLHARVEEEVVVDRELHPIQETARNLGPALLVVTFDAVFAFAALHFSKVPMIRDFGLLLAVGIVVICVCSIVVPLSILGIREFRSPTKGRDYRAGPLGRLVVRLGGLPDRSAPFLAAACVAVFAFGIAVEGRLRIQTDPIEWVNQDSQVIRDLDTVKREAQAADELGFYIQAGSDALDDTTVDFVYRFEERQLADHPEQFVTASSIVGLVGDLIDVPGGGDVPPAAQEVRRAAALAPPAIRAATIADEGRALNLVFRVRPGSLEERAAVIRDVRETVEPPPGVRATPSGLAVLGVGLLDNVEANRILLTYLAIGFVFLFLAVRLRSVVRSLLSLVPVMIAVGTASLVAWAAGLELSPMTAVGGPLVVAACTEFTSLILLRFVEERRRGATPREAVDIAASRTGRAFIVSALTAISGIAVIATSSLPLLRDFGMIVAINVAVALISALVVLPPVLAWADRRRWVSKGLVPASILDEADERERRGEPSPEALLLFGDGVKPAT